MTAVNAFDWKQYTDQEIAKRGDHVAVMNRNARRSATIAEGVHKLREKNPSHGTLHGLTTKRLNIKQPEMMRSPNAKAKK